MFRKQFDELRAERGIGSHGIVPKAANLRVLITGGAGKGRLAQVRGIQGSLLVVAEDNGFVRRVAYANAERVGEDGRPVPGVLHDITGRPISGTPVVCYSIAAGSNSHALEIGRVVRINPSGSLVVRPAIRNGGPLETHGRVVEHAQIKAERAILLPVPDALVTTWLLSGFSVFRAGALLE